MTAGSVDSSIEFGDPPLDARPDSPPPAVTVTFGERPGADHTGVTIDTWVDSSNAAINHGTDVGLYMDASPTVNSLLRFDLTALPPGTNVTASELVLATTTDSLPNGTVRIHPVLESWGELSATWTNRVTGTAWTTAGASAPGSQGAQLLGEFFPNVDLAPWTVPFDVATIRGWIDVPTSNRGMVMISTSSTGNGVTFSSSNDPAAGARPLLRITYQP